MAEYSFYKIDKDGRIFGPPVVAQCEDDDAALIVAQRYIDGLATEIWTGTRRVAFVPADDK